MLQLNRYVTASATLALALAIGFVMQGKKAPDDRTVAMPALASAGMTPTVTPRDNGPLKLDDVQRTAATSMPRDAAAPEPLPLVQMRAGPDDAASELDLPAETPAPALACDVTASAVSGPAAMVDLHIEAACLPDAPVTVHHNGMMFSTLSDARGVVDVSVPALSPQAVFIASYEGGQGAVAMTSVPDLVDYDRAVIQWQGSDMGVELHAMEFGANYGAPGHVWTRSPGSVQDAIIGQGGFVTDLGTASGLASLHAQVYTFPRGIAHRAGRVALSVETEIGAANCGRELVAQTLEVGGAAQPRVRDLTLFVPDCTAQGDFLVLKNVIEDLTIAAN